LPRLPSRHLKLVAPRGYRSKNTHSQRHHSRAAPFADLPYLVSCETTGLLPGHPENI